MSDRVKRILLIAVFVLLVALFFFLIYWVFFRTSPAKTNANNANTNSTLPGTQNGNVNRVVKNPDATNPLPNPATTPGGVSAVANGGATLAQTIVSGATSGLVYNVVNGVIQYYDKNTGQFYRIGADGKPELMTDAVYKGADTITWSPSGSQAVITFPDGSKILYDFNAKKQTTLPAELTGFSWSPQSDQLVSKYLDSSNTDNQWLMVTKPDGSAGQSVEQLGANADKVTPTWSPNNQVVGTYQKAAGTDSSEIVFLGAQNENFPSATVQGKGFIPTWSPDGQTLLYSTYSSANDDNPHLYVMSGSPTTLGTGMIDLGLDTRADKCTFTGNSQIVYCAVPYYLNAGSGPHPEFSAGIPDNIYRIDLTTGVSRVVARPVDSSAQQRFSATNLQLSADGKSLYFTDSITGSIEKITLP